MKTPQGTYIIRDKGQLTIPNKVRKALNWGNSGDAVSLYTTEDNELLIVPIKNIGEKKSVDWDKIWAAIKRVRSEDGENGNLTEFLVKDRESH